MENAEKIKIRLEKMLGIFHNGIGDNFMGDSGFYNPISAGMEIERIRRNLDELVKLLGYEQKFINNILRVVLRK